MDRHSHVDDWPTPTVDEIKALAKRLSPHIVRTPVLHWAGPEIEAALPGTEIVCKLELFQKTGTFKPRGALSVLLTLRDQGALGNGVTAVSAGNHAVAVAYAAQLVNTTAKVVMPSNANTFRVERCRSYGAEVILKENIAEAFTEVERIQAEEGRCFIHPFEGPDTTLGTATIGLELCEQAPGLEAVIVPIGGGGLAAGIASAVCQLEPQCSVYGVEPEGARSMSLSFASGKPEAIGHVETIADSLGAPYALEQSFTLCRRHIKDIVLVSDAALREAMSFLFENAKLAVEPAGAATTAALLGPLKSTLAGKRVGIIVCGANIDIDTFHTQVTSKRPLDESEMA